MTYHRGRWWLLIISILVALGISLVLWYWWQPTFSGRLVDLAGEPVANLAVRSSNQTVTSDADGNFTVRLGANDTAITVGSGEDTITIDLDATTAQATLSETETTAPTIEEINEFFGNDTASSLTPDERAELETEITSGYYPGSNAPTDTPTIVVPTLTVSTTNVPPTVDPTTIITNEEGVEVVQGEILVGWDATVTADQRVTAVTAAGGTMRFDDPAAFTSIVYVQDQANVAAAVELLQQTSGVTGALQNYLLEPDAVSFAPTDPDYSDKNKSWWLRRMNLEPAWQMTKGTNSTVVAVIDVGFAVDHPDLTGAFTKTTLNYTTDTLSVKSRHGTHVSGIIAARQNNDEGLTGVAPKVRILPIKIYDLARLPQVYQQLKTWPGVRIASMSMGWGWRKKNLARTQAGLPPFTPVAMQQRADALDAIIRPSFLEYYQRGGVFCKSAGNDYGYDAKLNALNFNEVITVAAGTPQGSLTNFSNIGASVDIVGPGYKIWSPVDSPKMYDYLSGTSMATPAVCGTVALIRSIRPQYGALLIRLILRKGATEPAGLAANGYSYVDAWRALLRATKRFGVTGLVFDENYNVAKAANVTTQPAAWLVETNETGDYVIPYLLRTPRTLLAQKGEAKGKESITPPALNDDEILEMVIIELAGKEDKNDNANNSNDNGNTNDGTDDANTSNTNADANANGSDSSDATDGVGESTTLANGVVVSAAGCAVSGYTMPDAIDDCGPGFSFSRETIACEQTECPAGVGRTYTLECKCEGEGLKAIYACDKPGYMVACINTNE